MQCQSPTLRITVASQRVQNLTPCNPPLSLMVSLSNHEPRTTPTLLHRLIAIPEPVGNRIAPVTTKVFARHLHTRR
ncbi:hypothetical protein FHW17_003052 [Phyllobacterium sp. P30BS-XVII]|nr:hypothetical protein [Phyllobacterium sp. P30BS-XVII]